MSRSARRLISKTEVGRPEVDRLFLSGEKVHQQRCQLRFVEKSRHIAIAGAVPAAAAAVCEQHHPACPLGQAQVALKCHPADRHIDQTLFYFFSCLLRHSYTAKGKVSGTSPFSQSAFRSSGSTARVSSKCR